MLKMLTRIFLALISLVLLFVLYPRGYFILDSKNIIKVENKAVNPEGLGIYIINLDRSPERYEYIKKSADTLGMEYERISGIDGAALSQEEIDKIVDFQTFKLTNAVFPRRGTIGCSLSHIKVWQTFINSNYEYALVLEDDVSFDGAKLKEAINELIKVNKLWDITTFELAKGGTPLVIKKLDNNQELVVYLNKKPTQELTF